MFRIHTYFVLASAAAVIAATLAIGYLFRQNAVERIVETAEADNVALAHVMSNSIWDHFGGYLRDVAPREDVDLSARRETDEIDAAIRSMTDGVKILKVKIYTIEGKTVYSSLRSQIGEWKTNESDFFTTAQNGKTQSELSTRDRFSAISGEVFNRDIIETYVPVIQDDRRIVGVFEIYSDVTSTMGLIDRSMVAMVCSLGLVFLVLYGVLVMEVRYWAIRPLQEVSARAETIGPNTPGRRLETKGMPGELLPIINSMNAALERLDRALDMQKRFSIDAAHQLLTPLAVLKANLETLPDRKVAERLHGDVDAMSEIVSRLLKIAALDNLEPGARDLVDLNETAAEVVATMAPLAVMAKKEIVFESAASEVKVRCCSVALNDAIRNLVDNALAFTPPGTHVLVKVTLDGTVSVRDHGVGVASSDRLRVFDRFWRGDQGEQDSRQGVGLGLAIVKKFAEVTGGTVDCTDAAGGGALFRLNLPVAEGVRG